MSYFRKIDVRIWNDAKFRVLSHHGKLAFIMLLTHPGMTSLGAMRATPEGLGAELKMEPKAFREAFAEVLREGLAEHDEEASCVLVPNFVRYQAAESPNVIKAWAKQLEWIPEGPLKTRAVAGVQAFVEGYGEAFRKAFRESFGKASLNQKAVSSKQKAVSPSLPSQGEGGYYGSDVHGGEPGVGADLESGAWDDFTRDPEREVDHDL